MKSRRDYHVERTSSGMVEYEMGRERVAGRAMMLGVGPSLILILPLAASGLDRLLPCRAASWSATSSSCTISAHIPRSLLVISLPQRRPTAPQT